MKLKRQYWLHTAMFDTVYIILPGFLALLITKLLPARFKSSDEMPLAGWVILILMVDVAHVYSTLFRTCLDKQRFSKQRNLFIAVPIVCYVVTVLLYSIDAMFFWRIMAYLAVFHFIRQQYGIMRLYARGEPKRTWRSRVDKIAIYAATIYPVVYWHLSPGRNFNWFLEGDFVIAEVRFLKEIALVLYLCIVVAYLYSIVYTLVKDAAFNIPKHGIIISTFLSWYFGIVYFNGDMAFTLLNVVAHGIPYMALVWAFRKREQVHHAQVHQRLGIVNSVFFFLIVVLVLAFVEEGLWDGLVWHERKELFNAFWILPAVSGKEMLALTIPLLSLPQVTHYVLDGFIWKKDQPAAQVKRGAASVA